MWHFYNDSVLLSTDQQAETSLDEFDSFLIFTIVGQFDSSVQRSKTAMNHWPQLVTLFVCLKIGHT